ncbi:DUF4249 family protein [Litoribacter ruber]|uniref:DUF4249 family protein n=1 Tax=Litoribacter ruber TaxID=702568 RepID=A0AAP2CGG5_9BACT|nr:MULTISPECIES: DUF4249 family protein [Litoribacter]MBS9523637.1 DUF4249 family protein [Litoribacter alkaliphilus]MBT0812151.1 DUF4249 family protein [Litoribacter ruber]
MKKLLYTIGIICLSMTSCIDEVNLRTETQDTKLVIDAWISNDPEMSYVKVYESTPFVSGDFHLPLEDVPISGAWVENRNGFVTSFRPPSYPSHGLTVYSPFEEYDFEPGDQFKLIVILSNGDRVESDWQEVHNPAGRIAFDYELSFQTVFIDRWNGEPFPQRREYWDFNARIEKANAQENHNYYVKASGIEQLYTAGLVENCTCTCYLSYPNLNYSLTAVNSSSPASTYTVPMGRMEAGRNTRFYLKADVYSVSEQAAAYLSSIGVQQTNTGSIFDPMPFKISGNLRNTDNPEQEILGQFSTAYHTSFDEMINRATLFSENRDKNIKLIYPASVTGSCLEEYPEADTSPPAPFRMQ